jgi:predicted transcriptional regulator
MHKTTLYLPDATRRRLREMARRTGRPQSDLVRQALEGYLGSEGSPLPKSIGAGEDPDLFGRNSEDWLRANWRPR